MFVEPQVSFGCCSDEKKHLACDAPADSSSILHFAFLDAFTPLPSNPSKPTQEQRPEAFVSWLGLVFCLAQRVTSGMSRRARCAQAEPGDLHPGPGGLPTGHPHREFGRQRQGSLHHQQRGVLVRSQARTSGWKASVGTWERQLSKGSLNHGGCAWVCLETVAWISPAPNSKPSCCGKAEAICLWKDGSHRKGHHNDVT